MRLFATVAVASALILSGCSSTPTETAVEPTPPSDEEVLQDWADSVCASADALQVTVTAAATNFDFDVSAGLDQLPQIQEQVAANIDAVETQIDELQLALSDAPPSSPAAERLAGELGGLITSARDSGREAVDLLGQATAADNFLEAGLTAASAVAAAESAYSDATAAIDALDELRTTSTGDVGKAFSSAPACG